MNGRTVSTLRKPETMALTFRNLEEVDASGQSLYQ